ncbi:ABC transporter permease subunit [Viridibacillus sp. YIM B01967]|uniref:ABC transporter permease subunit n=1 Tax=Viridibacillus soli TaxID=2798301 RepID=A0ABS1H277_9BACL|nr:ABC transporter permease subunit [Viridibacillus soli]MBK3493517.1 ABC transporter permease subunit [Viridibacillus soli]
MMQWRVLLQKEWRDHVRNLKILWIPIVFVLYGIMQPVMFYYMEDIMKAVGNMPEGVDMGITDMTSADVMASTVGQFHLIVALIVILSFMGVISKERKNRTAALLYVRPISFSAYYLSKLSGATIVALLSTVLGLLASFYYTMILYDEMDVWKCAALIGTYSLWVLFVVTVTLTASAVFSTGVAGTLAFLLTYFMQLIDSIIGQFWTVSPWKLGTYAITWLVAEPDSSDFWLSVVVTVIAILLLVIIGIWGTRKNVENIKI